MKKGVVLATCLLTLAGCASKKGDEFATHVASKSRVHNLNSIASISGSALGADVTQGELSSKDEFIALDANKSAFDVYQIKTTAGTHRFNVKTYCDCLGFSKDMIQPDIRVYYKNNQALQVSLVNLKRVQPFAGALYIEYLYDLKVPANGDYKVLVSSKNDRLGTEVVRTEMAVDLITGTPFTMSIVAAPYGKYDIAFK